MPSRSSGPLTTLLIFLPLVVVAGIALFGLPQIGPVNASPGLNEANHPAASPGQPGAVDLSGDVRSRSFAPVDIRSNNRDQQYPANDFRNQGANHSSGLQGGIGQPSPPRRDPRWEYRDQWSPPAESLTGWELQTISNDVNPVKDQVAGDLFAQGSIPTRFNEARVERTPAENEHASLDQMFTEVDMTKNVSQPAGQSLFDERSEVPQEYRMTPAMSRERTPRPPAAADPSHNQPVSWGSAVAQLNRLGIRDYRLEAGSRPGLFYFTCSYTPGDNPRISRRFEAEASEPLKAVEKVLLQVDQWQQMRPQGQTGL